MQYAYSTDAPAAVAAYRQTRADLRTYGERVQAACAALGGNKGPLVHHGVWGRPDELVGLEPDGSGVIPEGWRIVRGRLEPRRGKPGEAARQWLEDHRPPDVRHTLTKYGLPRHAAIPAGTGASFTHRLVSPLLFEHDGTLWSRYEGKPGDHFDGSDDPGCTWTPRPLSEFYAAREAVEAAHARNEAVSQG